MSRKCKAKIIYIMKLQKKTIIIYIFAISIILALFLIKYYSNTLQPNLIKYSTTETERLITLVINKSTSEFIKNTKDINEIYIIQKNDNNQISTLDLNTDKVNELLNSINNVVQKNIKNIEKGKISKLELEGMSDIDYEEIEGGVLYYIPVGNINNSFLINNIFPQIPIKFSLAGDVVSKLNSSIKEYGINNAMIKLEVKVSVSMLITLPFLVKKVTISNTIPVSVKLIQGVVPEYYLPK